MNTRDLGKLSNLVSKLKLSQKNVEIAMDYLTAEYADDSLLEGVEHQNFRQLDQLLVISVWNHLTEVRKSNRPLLSRYLKLFWAIGRSTACVLWGMSHTNEIHREEQLEWKLEVLPAAAVAAMYADMIGYSIHKSENWAWLEELARSEPETLELAQSLNGNDSENMAVILAMILLSNCEDAEVVGRQTDLLLRNINETMPVAAPWMAADLRQALCDYIAAGDHAAPVPLSFTLTAADALQARHFEDSLSGLLGSACFLSQHADERLRCALRVLLSLNPTMVLNEASRLASAELLEKRLNDLRRDIPGGSATLLLYFSVGRWWIEPEQKMALLRRCADGAAEALKHANATQYMGITEAIPGADRLCGDERDLICNTLQRVLRTGKDELRTYLFGTGSLKDSRAELDAVERIPYHSPGQASILINMHRVNHGWDDFACRCAAALWMVYDGDGLAGMLAKVDPETVARVASYGGYVRYGVLDHSVEELERMLSALLEKGLPLAETLGMAGSLYDETYNDELKKKILACAYLSAKKPEYIPALTVAVKKGTVFARQTAVNALYNLAPEYPEAKAGFFSAAGDSSKQIKENLVTLLVGRPEWAEDVRQLLASKKASERQIAVQVLGRLGHRDWLENHLATEKNVKVADAIRTILGAEAAPVGGSALDLAAELLKGSKIKKLSWLLDQPMVKLRKPDGTDADEAIRNAILLSYCELGRIGRSETAELLAAEVDGTDLARLACEVYEHWYAAGAQTRHKWVLAFAAIHGGSAMTQRLKSAIQDWPNHQRGAIACEAVMALALSPDPAAIVIVDSISRKFKFRQVKQAAAAALENAAKELGITAEELADRIVPDLGFGKDGKRTFDYGKRSFTVRLTPTLELEITNDQGKTVKNLPAPGKTDDPQANDAYEAFKDMKKQIKTTVAAQRVRLEAALSVLRCWTTDRWRALFVENPIMHQFAMSLIWGVYEDGALTDTFRYMEDGSFNTVDEDEYELPENARIGLVHPVELDEETLAGWKQQLEDYEITQSLEQLSRPIYALNPKDADKRELEDFGGKMLNGLSLCGKLLGFGWYRGSVVDGGMYETYFREDKDLNIGVELRFSGSFVGYDDGEPVTVYDAVFYRDTVRRGSYVYDQIAPENIVPLGQVPVRYYSEIIHRLTRATASSTDTNENWKKDR